MYFMLLNTRYNVIDYYILLGKIGLGTHPLVTAFEYKH